MLRASAKYVGSTDSLDAEEKEVMRMNLWTNWDVQSYIIESYAGVEQVDGKPVRRFLWADGEGEVWIGNSAAFAEHLAEKFQYRARPYDYVNINRILIDAGERLIDRMGRTPTGAGAGQAPLAPDRRPADSRGVS